MNDLISRQDAIDYIKTQRGRPFIGITLEEAIIMMIEEVPSADRPTVETCSSASDWMPCSERLPEGGEEVLGTDDKGTVWMVFMRSKFKTGESCFETAEEGMLIDIAAWMPLPEPWKGGEQDV